ncbi:DUF2513 domain-containing protein [Ligilactobacillus aviarius]|uniref:DUF2513 domain-containing protein n=1 Tax=Ligilactobacillus aviarius TaxID=1606 RepID=UPI0024BAB3B7|nr:DUF2513 domain-containing protein [Ligilactobacillus aviarius]
MELNPDCLRDILSEIAKLPMGNFLNTLPKEITDKYSEDDIEYTIQIIEEEELAHVSLNWGNNVLARYSLGQVTLSGQQLYSKIKSDTVWNKVKDKIRSIGSAFSVELIKIAAGNIINGML